MDIIGPLQTFRRIIPVDGCIEMGPFQRRVASINIRKGFPDATTLVNLVRTEGDQRGEIRISPSSCKSFCPQCGTFTDFPITLTDRNLSPRDQRGFGFFAHEFRWTGIRHKQLPMI